MIRRAVSVHLKRSDYMCKRFDDWSHEIKIFCEVNGFSFEKARKLSKSWGKDDLVLQYYDPNNDTAKKRLGLLDETPMPVVLRIYRRPDGSLDFEKTEYTNQYLV